MFRPNGPQDLRTIRDRLQFSTPPAVSFFRLGRPGPLTALNCQYTPCALPSKGQQLPWASDILHDRSCSSKNFIPLDINTRQILFFPPKGSGGQKVPRITLKKFLSPSSGNWCVIILILRLEKTPKGAYFSKAGRLVTCSSAFVGSG